MALRVTDHALLRWLERVYGLDLDALRERIVEVPGMHDAVRLGATRVPVDGLVYCFEGNSLVTICPRVGRFTPNEHRSEQKRRKRDKVFREGRRAAERANA